MKKMDISPSYKTIGHIFEQNFLFEVPKYQRYYAWEDEQVDDFVKDIASIADSIHRGEYAEHFFGGIVCVEKKISGSNRQQRELIDGQQRITTTILLVKNIIAAYKKLKNVHNTSIIDSRIEKLKIKYFLYKDEINRMPVEVKKLVLSNADNDFFQALIEESPINPIRDSHYKLNAANKRLFKFVTSQLGQYSTTDEKIDCLGRLENIIHNNCNIIFIDASTKEAAYKLFQVLNDRGVGLTAGDLLKSKTLESFEKHFATKQVQLEKDWNSILLRDAKETESFLRTFFASVQGKRAGRATLYDDFLLAFFPKLINKVSIENDEEANELSSLVSGMLFEFDLYNKIKSGEWVYEPNQPVTDWQRKRLSVIVDFLDYDIVLPLLLAAVNLSEKKFAKIVWALERFMFRYKTLCSNSHQKMSAIFMKESKLIRDDPQGYDESNFISNLKSILMADAPDEKVAVNIKALKYCDGGNKVIRYLLSTINEFFENTMPAMITDYTNVSIEHIVPISNGGINPLGIDINLIQNLTILTLQENDKAKNKVFNDKIAIYNDSHYKLNKMLATYQTWDKPTSDIWLNVLVTKALEIYKL